MRRKRVPIVVTQSFSDTPSFELRASHACWIACCLSPAKPEDIVVLRPVTPGIEFMLRRVDATLEIYNRRGFQIAESHSPIARNVIRAARRKRDALLASLYNRERWVAAWHEGEISLIDLCDHTGALYNHAAFIPRAQVTGLPFPVAAHIGDPISISDALLLCQGSPGAMWTVERNKNVLLRAVAFRPEADLQPKP